MNNDLINRDALKRALRQRQWHIDDIEEVMKIIDNAPAVDISGNEYFPYRTAYFNGVSDGRATAIPQGEWIYNQYDGNANIGNWHCSECRHIVCGGYSQKPYYNFCPNCGAKMQKAVQNDES